MVEPKPCLEQSSFVLNILLGKVVMKMNSSRRPTGNERKELAHYFARARECSDSDARRIVNNAYIAVFPKYSHAYSHTSFKVLVVIWHFGEQFYDAFCWADGQLQLLNKEQLFKVHYSEAVDEIIKMRRQKRR